MEKGREVGTIQAGVVVARNVKLVEVLVVRVVVQQFHPPECLSDRGRPGGCVEAGKTRVPLSESVLKYITVGGVTVSCCDPTCMVS